MEGDTCCGSYLLFGQFGGWFSEEYVEEAIADLNADMSEAMISVDLVHVGYKDLEDYSWYDSYAFNPNGNWCFPFSVLRTVF